MSTLIKFCLLFSFGLLILKEGYPQQKSKQQQHFSVQQLTFLDMLGDTLSYKKDIGQHPLLLVYFRPDCEDCVHTARLLKRYASAYPLDIWLVSTVALDQLQTFETMMDLYNIDNLKLLWDYTGSMHQWFDFKWIPFIALFDQNGKEIKTFEALPAPKTIASLLGKG